MTDEPGGAPLAELRLAGVIHTYERIKLGLLSLMLVAACVVLGLVLKESTETHATARQTKQSLIIITCAIDKTTRLDARGNPRSSNEVQVAFDACVKNGGPPKQNGPVPVPTTTKGTK